MKSTSLLCVLIFSSAFGALASVSDGAVTAVANVLSSTSTSTTVQFTFSGDLGGVTKPVNLQDYLFFGLSPQLVSSTTTSSADIVSLPGNSVQMTPSLSLSLIEVRVNGAPFYDRMGFKFASSLSTSSAFVSGSSVTVTLPIGSATSSSFDGLPIYWGMPANYSDDNNARGTLVGTVVAVPEVSSALVASLVFVPSSAGRGLPEPSLRAGLRRPDWSRMTSPRPSVSDSSEAGGCLSLARNQPGKTTRFNKQTSLPGISWRISKNRRRTTPCAPWRIGDIPYP